MDKTLTEQQVAETKRGRPYTEAELNEVARDRYFRGTLREFFDLKAHLVYKVCDICNEPICVNNWDDGKARTPRFKGFIVCPNCDPRPVQDRYMKQGYRIVWPGRLRVIRYAQVTRAMSIRGCIISPQDERYGDDNCKCAGCASRKLMPLG